jgi:adiponectin receptor
MYPVEPAKPQGFIGNYEDYPEDLRDNEFLRTGYRCQFNTWPEIWSTLFMWHNETVNVWTHFLGCLGFVIAVFVVAFGLTNLRKDGMIMLKQFEKIQDSSMTLDGFIDFKFLEMEQEIDQADYML